MTKQFGREKLDLYYSSAAGDWFCDTSVWKWTLLAKVIVNKGITSVRERDHTAVPLASLRLFFKIHVNKLASSKTYQGPVFRLHVVQNKASPWKYMTPRASSGFFATTVLSPGKKTPKQNPDCSRTSSP